ncbi:MAG: N-6 DNA methylase [Candidatus Gastranaerophilaceae bacterium]
MDYLKQFISKLHNLDKAKRINEVFKDFLILCTCSLAQPFYRSDKIEQRYLNTVKQYKKEQAEEFSKLLALLVMALEEKHQDFLGQVYMQLNLGNVATGQFFTPYHISKLMSEINFIEIEDKLKDQEFITLSDPCCGSAGMIIAFAETIKNKGYNYQNQLYVEVIDIDEMCFMMAYIQLSLLGVGARVIHGDSLTLNFHKVLYTPFYFVNGVGWKLKLQNKAGNNALPQNVNNKQLTLFNF